MALLEPSRLLDLAGIAEGAGEAVLELAVVRIGLEAPAILLSGSLPVSPFLEHPPLMLGEPGIVGNTCGQPVEGLREGLKLAAVVEAVQVGFPGVGII